MSINLFTDEYIVSSIQTMFQKKLKDILTDISEKYSIDQKQLFDCYLEQHNSETDNGSKNKKKKTKKKDEEVAICLARKADGGQCTRHRKDSSEYCGKHSISLKFGRIDDVSNNDNDDDNMPIDKDKFIMTWKETIDNIEYLVDSNSIVYGVDHSIIGKKNNEGKLVLLADIMSNNY
jgi:hypothetical protein